MTKLPLPAASASRWPPILRAISRSASSGSSAARFPASAVPLRRRRQPGGYADGAGQPRRRRPRAARRKLAKFKLDVPQAQRARRGAGRLVIRRGQYTFAQLAGWRDEAVSIRGARLQRDEPAAARRVTAAKRQRGPGRTAGAPLSSHPRWSAAGATEQRVTAPAALPGRTPAWSWRGPPPSPSAGRSGPWCRSPGRGG